MRRSGFPTIIPAICFCLIPVRVAAQTRSVRISDPLAFRGALAPEIVSAHANSINSAEAARLFPSLTDADLKNSKTYIKLLPVLYELQQYPENTSFEKAAQSVISAAWSEAQELMQKAASSQTKPSDLPKIALRLETLGNLRAVFFTEDQLKEILSGYDSTVERLTEKQRIQLETSKRRVASILNRYAVKLAEGMYGSVVLIGETSQKKRIALRSALKPGRQAADSLHDVLSDSATLEEKEAAAIKYGAAVGNRALGKKLAAAMHDRASLEYPAIILPLSMVETLAKFGGREAIGPLLKQVRRRPVSHFRFEQRTVADITALIKIAQKYHLERDVEKQIVDILFARYKQSPSDGDLAQNIARVLDGVFDDPNLQFEGFNDDRIREFLYHLLNHKDPKVRKTAAGSFDFRNDARRVIDGLHGIGIQPEYQTEVRKELIRSTIFVDKTLRANESVAAEVRKLAKEDASQEVREAANETVEYIDIERGFYDKLKTLSPEELARFKSTLNDKPRKGDSATLSDGRTSSLLDEKIVTEKAGVTDETLRRIRRLGCQGNEKTCARYAIAAGAIASGSDVSLSRVKKVSANVIKEGITERLAALDERIRKLRAQKDGDTEEIQWERKEVLSNLKMAGKNANKIGLHLDEIMETTRRLRLNALNLDPKETADSALLNYMREHPHDDNYYMRIAYGDKRLEYREKRKLRASSFGRASRRLRTLIGRYLALGYPVSVELTDGDEYFKFHEVTVLQIGKNRRGEKIVKIYDSGLGDITTLLWEDFFAKSAIVVSGRKIPDLRQRRNKKSTFKS